MLIVGKEISREEELLRIDLPIPSSNKLILVVAIRNPVDDPSARIIGGWNHRQKLQCDRIQQRRIDPVSLERSVQVPPGACSNPCEIALKRRGGVNKVDVRGRRDFFVGTLIAGKEKQLVLHDRPPDDSTKLMTLE